MAQKAARQFSPSHRLFARGWPSIDRIEGFLVPGQEWWLFKTAYRLPDDAVIVEIGSFRGRSTACLALGCVGMDKRVHAIDTFNGNETDFAQRDFFPDFDQNLRTAGLRDRVVPHVGRSSDVAASWTLPIDFLFIDGSHDYDDVASDFEGFYPHVKAGGLVAFHDVVETWPGPLEFWQRVATRRLDHKGACSTIAFGRKPSGTVMAQVAAP